MFDRILKEGNGPTDYGIMVGKSLGLPDELIEIANNTKKILNNVSENIVPEKTSNTIQMLMDMCKMPGCKNKACEIIISKNNILPIRMVTLMIFIKMINITFVHYVKNHDQITYGNLLIKGYLDTSEGLKLDYEYTDKKEK